jgi:hypothetical protein
VPTSVVCAGRLVEERKKVEQTLQELDDAEVILHRAVARKTKEDRVLPL